METNKKEFLILKRFIYGLFQSSREFYNKLVLSLKGFGFKGSPVDPCLRINIQSLELSWLQFMLITVLLLEAKIESRI